MPKFLILFSKTIDAINYRIGRITMYSIFLMIGVLIWSSVAKTFFVPSLWTLELAQFAMVAYYILGGPYSIQLKANVRMDLLYGSWSDVKKAKFDAFTVLILIFYLGVLLYGSLDSTTYSIRYSERSNSAWRPYMWPIKIIMSFGFFLMILQSLSCLIKDIAKIRSIKF